MVSLTVPRKALQTDSNLLRALEEDSEVLQNITDQFAPLLHRFRVFFFWEQERTDLKYTKDYIVDEVSAAPILDNTERSGIAADHRDMCRFERKDSPGFRTVMAALKRYCQEAPEVVRVRSGKAVAELGAQRWCEAEELLRCTSEGTSRRNPTNTGLSSDRQERGNEPNTHAERHRWLEQEVVEANSRRNFTYV